METPLGKVCLLGKENKLCGLWFVGQKHYPPKDESWQEDPYYPLFIKVDKWLKAYFNGDFQNLDAELCPAGTKFQQQIWKKLIGIPRGKTTSYGKLFPSSARAAGGAVGRNPISIIIPCHRVIGSDKSLTGYAGGLDRKKALLELEGYKLEKITDSKFRVC